jgi:hypothetical protein
MHLAMDGRLDAMGSIQQIQIIPSARAASTRTASYYRCPTPTKRRLSTPVKLLDQVRQKLRLRHYAMRTEEAYIDWIRRYILFHHKRHPREMEGREVEAFLTHPVVERCVAASTPKSGARRFAVPASQGARLRAPTTRPAPGAGNGCPSCSPPMRCARC